MPQEFGRRPLPALLLLCLTSLALASGCAGRRSSTLLEARPPETVEASRSGNGTGGIPIDRLDAAAPAPRSLLRVLADAVRGRPRAQRTESRRTSTVRVLHPLLGERILHLAHESPSFRAGWEVVENSGVTVTIGTDRQLAGMLPRWFRDNPDKWVGLNVNESRWWGAGIRRAAVGVRVDALRSMDAEYAGGSGTYLLAEIDRILIHEIFGHLVPVLQAGSALHVCSDEPEEGSVTSCVSEREQLIATELEQTRAQAAGRGIAPL